ncbi:hypothetical protein RvY_19010 [Ramazzottius varieornatus]|uniref:7TM GPCR serpentine receptor class x (Srx) domain-containing protein n=1 Tax=Ramazzottius varieornatus TaxID=947166 RepID=A0A1D1W7W3_RAMVA|nr:hypothetical protein RvY_19010 [Ramazzottius varieornatus]
MGICDADVQLFRQCLKLRFSFHHSDHTQSAIRFLTEGTLLFISYPVVTVQTYLARDHPPTPSTCQTVGWIYYVILLATHWTEMLIALNRFVAVIFPHQYKAVTRKEAIKLMPIIQAGATIDSNNFWKSCTLRGLKGRARDFFILLCFNAYVPIGVEGALYLTMFCLIFIRRLRRS